jgi:hypothetical protein
VLRLAVFTPCLIGPVGTGHPSLFWAAGLVAALALRERGLRLGAGVLIGLLTVKPSLGVLLAVALLAARDWRTAGAAAAAALGLAGLATAFTGADYWPALAAKMAEHAASAASVTGIGGEPRMIGAQAALLQAGAPGEVAALAHALLAALAVGLVALLWARPARTDAALRIGVLLVLLPMVAPSVWFYDAIAMTAGAFALTVGGALPARPWAAALALALWANVWPALYLGFPVAFVTLPAALGVVALGVAALRAEADATARAPRWPMRAPGR